MSSLALVTLIQQTSQILDTVAPKVKIEADKKIAEIEQKIPTPESVKQIMMDEISSKGPELVCSIEVQDRIESIYFKLIANAEKLEDVINKSQEKLQKLQEDLFKITAILTAIEGLLALFKDVLIPAFTTIRITAAAGLFLLKGPAADGDATIRLADTMKKSQSQKESMENSIKVFSRKVKKIRKKVAIPLGILTLALGVISTIKIILTSLISVIKSHYTKYLLLCNTTDDGTIDDELYLDIQKKFNIDVTEDINEEDLLPNTIERIKNAKLEIIRYRIT
jgi:hypothetical protein